MTIIVDEGLLAEMEAGASATKNAPWFDFKPFEDAVTPDRTLALVAAHRAALARIAEMETAFLAVIETGSDGWTSGEKHADCLQISREVIKDKEPRT